MKKFLNQLIGLTGYQIKNQKLWLDIIKYMQKHNYKFWSIDQLLKNNDSGQTYQLDIFFYKKK